MATVAMVTQEWSVITYIPSDQWEINIVSKFDKKWKPFRNYHPLMVMVVYNETGLEPVLMSKDPAPKGLLELTVCRCRGKSACKSKDC